MKKFLIIFGTRPEAIKMAPLVLEFLNYSKNNPNTINLKVCITAQHRKLLDQVLDVFDINPDFDLDIMQENQDLYNLSSRILLKVGDILESFNPDLVFVHGDTTTSFISTLAAFYKQISVAHIEAGLRTNDIYSPWPEEANRQLTSKLAKYHFAPTENSKNNLLKENVSDRSIFVTGNTVIDALIYTKNKIEKNKDLQKKLESEIALNFDIKKEKFILVTGHRRENFGESFINICNALKIIAKNNSDYHIVYPMHLNPNVREPVMQILDGIKNIHLIEPLEYLSFIHLMNNSYLILTDSGGIQEEAPSLGKPVLVMRENTERPEALDYGTVRLVGTNTNKITAEVQELIDNNEIYTEMAESINPYGDGTAAKKIIEALIKDEQI